MTDSLADRPVEARVRLLSGADMWNPKDVPEASLPKVTPAHAGSI